MSKHTIRIATRKSPLALWQANFIGHLLKQHWPEVDYELLPLQTSGDRFYKDRLQTLGGKGLFVKELEEALLDKRADLAVHSMKDVPVELPAGLQIAAICQRDNPSDALISRKFKHLDELPAHAVIGTASLRRQSQLLHLYPRLEIKPLRGNIQTRIQKLDDESFDAIILAAAGLIRMNLDGLISQIIPTDTLLPACGQGALGIECSEDNERIMQWLKPLNDPLSALCVHAERHVNAVLGGNCHVPLAVFSKPLEKGQISLKAKLLSLDGRHCIADEQTGDAHASVFLADTCAKNMLRLGAREMLETS